MISSLGQCVLRPVIHGEFKTSPHSVFEKTYQLFGAEVKGA
jgi:hypothetical protein